MASPHVEPPEPPDAGAVEDWLRRCRDARDRGEAVPRQLFRRLMEHDGFMFSPYTQSEAADGDVYLDGVAGAPEELSMMNGLQLAHAIPAGLQTLRIHFDKSPPLALGEDDIRALQTFLQVTVVEALLGRLFRGEELEVSEPFAMLRSFDHFYILCDGAKAQLDGDGGASTSPLLLALAPDPDGGRTLAAAFTALDALQLFVVASDHARGSDGLVSVRLSGQELFERLRTQDGLDGVVFNPAGPASPIAFAKSVADVILEG